MTEPDRFQFSRASAAQARETHFAPRLEEPWGKLLLDAAAVRAGETVLDSPAGTGTVARLAAVRVGPQGRVIAAEPGPQNVGIARSKPVLHRAARIDFVESPAAPLAVAPRSVDVALCWPAFAPLPDLPAALGELRRVLRPGGRMVVALWHGIEQCSYFGALRSTLRETGASDAAVELLEAPFRFAGEDQLQAAALAAGMLHASVETIVLELRFERGVAQALAATAGLPCFDGAVLTEEQRGQFARVASGRLEAFVASDGAVVCEMQASVAVGRL